MQTRFGFLRTAQLIHKSIRVLIFHSRAILQIFLAFFQLKLNILTNYFIGLNKIPSTFDPGIQHTPLRLDPFEHHVDDINNK